MKKITLNINLSYIGQDDTRKIQEVLTSLSGVVGAEVLPGEGKAYAYAGDELDALVVAETASKAGFPLSVTGEEYFADLSDFKSGRF